MKLKMIIWTLLVSFLSVHSLSVVHSSVHFFHAEETPHNLMLEVASSSDLLDIQLSVDSHHYDHSDFSLDEWVCDFYDPLTQAALYPDSSSVSLSCLMLQSVSFELWQTIDVNTYYPAFWGRAPPAFPFV